MLARMAAAYVSSDLARVVRPLVHDLVRRRHGQHRHRRAPAGHAALGGQRHPRAVLLVLGDAERELAGMAERRAVELARDAAEHVDDEQAQRAADRGVGAAPVGERVVGGVHAEGAAGPAR